MRIRGALGRGRRQTVLSDASSPRSLEIGAKLLRDPSATSPRDQSHPGPRIIYNPNNMKITHQSTTAPLDESYPVIATNLPVKGALTLGKKT